MAYVEVGEGRPIVLLHGAPLGWVVRPPGHRGGPWWASEIAIASRAATRFGRRVKIEQAEKVISLLGNKARAHPGDEAAVNLWCDALVAALRPLRK